MPLKRARWFGAALFVYAAIVQYNDPDFLPWASIYLACAAASAISTLRKVPSFVYLVIALASTGWMISLLPSVIRAGEYTATEIERESFGLVLVAAWMFVLFWKDRR